MLMRMVMFKFCLSCKNLNYNCVFRVVSILVMF